MCGRGHTIACRSPTPKPYISVCYMLYVPKKEVVLAGHLLSGQVTVCHSAPGLHAPEFRIFP